jgi:uncharacterized protein (TIGR03435 family)
MPSVVVSASVMLCVVMVLASLGRTMEAQTTTSLAGTWQGTLPVSGGQRVIVKISKASSGGADKRSWNAVFYNLDAHAEDLGRLATSITLDGLSLKFAVGSIDASYAGTLAADGASIAGTWTEAALSTPLVLRHVAEDGAWELPDAAQYMPKDAAPEFEVATIKPTAPDWNRWGYHVIGRHISCDNETVNTMMRYVYSVSGRQIEGGPDWVNTTLYNVDGVPDIAGTPSTKQMMGMYRKLLADGFQLAFHREKKELPVYALTVAKSGSKLAKSLGDPDGLPDETGYGDRTGQTIHFTNTSMDDLAALLQTVGSDGKPVVNQTGLAGRFDFTLHWTRDETAATEPGAAPGLFTAIQEQLGLKLEPVKAPVDVLVIDRAERPSVN